MPFGLFAKRSATDLNSEGLKHMMARKYDDAIGDFDKAIKIDPQYAEAWLNKGKALYYGKKKYNDALIAIEKAIELGSLDAMTWTLRGNTLSDLGKPDEAIQAYDKAIQVNPQFAMAWNNKSLILRKQGKYDEALLLVNKAIELQGPESTTELPMFQKNKLEIQKKLGISADEIIPNNPNVVSKNIAKILQRRGISPNEVLIATEGANGQICLTEKGVLIGREGGLGTKMLVGYTKGEKLLPYRNITSVQFKEPGMTWGYIQFTVPGGIENRGGAFDAGSDENTVTFYSNALESFRNIRNIVEERQGLGTVPMPQAPTPQIPPKSSIADELTKLAALKRDGAINEKEFEQLKKDLLSNKG
jgi:hypothetical protein